MFSLIKQVFIVLFSFTSSLASVDNVRTKFLSLNDNLCLVRSTLIDLNPAELKYYPFMINLDKSSGSHNFSSPKYVFQRKQDINVKAFNMIKNQNETKIMTKHI